MAAIPYLTVFPYLGLKKELLLWDNLRLWNFNLCSTDHLDDEMRGEAERMVSMYEHPEWVCVLSDKNKSPPVKIDQKVIRKVQLLLFIATLSKGNTRACVIGNDSTSSSAENFAFSELPLESGQSGVEFQTGNVLKNIKRQILISRGCFPHPMHVPDRTDSNNEIDQELFDALVSLEKRKKRKASVIYDSLEMFFLPMLNYNLIPVTSAYLLLVAAFENLLGSDRRKVKDALDRIFGGGPQRPSYYESRGKIYPEMEQEKMKLRSIFSTWYEQLVRFRNRIVHGGEYSLPKRLHNYHGQSHRYIAMLIFVSCIKGILKEEMDITLSGKVVRKKIRGKMYFMYEE